MFRTSEVGLNSFSTKYVDQCNFVINEFNPTSEVQNMGNEAFQNAPFANVLFANGSFPNGGYSCLWALPNQQRVTNVTNKCCCICFSDEKDHLGITP